MFNLNKAINTFLEGVDVKDNKTRNGEIITDTNISFHKREVIVKTKTEKAVSEVNSNFNIDEFKIAEIYGSVKDMVIEGVQLNITMKEQYLIDMVPEKNVQQQHRGTIIGISADARKDGNSRNNPEDYLIDAMIEMFQIEDLKGIHIKNINVAIVITNGNYSINLLIKINGIEVKREAERVFIVGVYGVNIYLKEEDKEELILSIGREESEKVEIRNIIHYIIGIIKNEPTGDPIELKCKDVTLYISEEMLNMGCNMSKSFKRVIKSFLTGAAVEEEKQQIEEENKQKEEEQKEEEEEQKEEEEEQKEGWFGWFFNKIIPLKEPEEEEQTTSVQSHHETTNEEKEQSSFNMKIEPAMAIKVVLKGNGTEVIEFMTEIIVNSSREMEVKVKVIEIKMKGKTFIKICNENGNKNVIEIGNKGKDINIRGNIEVNMEGNDLDDVSNVLNGMVEKVNTILNTIFSLYIQNKKEEENDEEPLDPTERTIKLFMDQITIQMKNGEEKHKFDVKLVKQDKPIFMLQSGPNPVTEFVSKEIKVNIDEKECVSLQTITLKIYNGIQNPKERKGIKQLVKGEEVELMKRKDGVAEIEEVNKAFPVLEDAAKFNQLKSVFRSSEYVFDLLVQGDIKINISTKIIRFLGKVANGLMKDIMHILEPFNNKTEESKKEVEEEKKEKIIVSEEMDEINAGEEDISEIINNKKKESNETKEKLNDLCFILTVGGNVSVGVEREEERLEFKLESTDNKNLSIIHASNIVGTGIGMTYIHFDKCEITLDYKQRKWDGKTERMCRNQLITIKDLSVLLSENEKELNNENNKKLLKCFSPRNMKKYNIVQIKSIIMKLHYSLEDIYFILGMVEDMKGKEKEEIKEEGKEEIKEEEKEEIKEEGKEEIKEEEKEEIKEEIKNNSLLPHTFIKIDECSLKMIALEGIVIFPSKEGTEQVPTLQLDLKRIYGHIYDNGKCKLMQFLTEINFFGMNIKTLTNMSLGEELAIAMPVLDLTGTVDYKEIYPLVNTISAITVLMNPYERSQKSKEGGIEITHMKWKEWFGEEMNKSLRIEVEKKFGTLENRIDKQKNDIKYSNETHLFFDQETKNLRETYVGTMINKSNETMINKSNETHSEQIEDNNSFFDQKMNLSHTCDEQKEEVRKEEKVPMFKLIECNVNLNVKLGDAYLSIVVNKINGKVDIEKEYMNIEFKITPVKVLFKTPKSTESMLEITESIDIKVKTIKPKSVQGIRDEAAYIIDLTNNKAKLNLNVPLSLISYIKDLIPDGGNETPQWLEEITAPPFILNLKRLTLQSIETNGSLGDFWETKGKIDEVIIENVIGDFGTLVVCLQDQLKDQAWQNIYPLLLMVLSGFLPQLKNIAKLPHVTSLVKKIIKK